MNLQLVFNWKSFAAIGASVVGIILAVKLSPDQAAAVSICALDAGRQAN